MKYQKYKRITVLIAIYVVLAIAIAIASVSCVPAPMPEQENTEYQADSYNEIKEVVMPHAYCYLYKMDLFCIAK
jgi:hypothetical protein